MQNPNSYCVCLKYKENRRRKSGRVLRRTSSDKTTVVLHALVSTARGFLLLILLRYLWRLASHFPCAGQRSMHLTCTTTPYIKPLMVQNFPASQTHRPGYQLPREYRLVDKGQGIRDAQKYQLRRTKNTHTTARLPTGKRKRRRKTTTDIMILLSHYIQS